MKKYSLLKLSLCLVSLLAMILSGCEQQTSPPGLVATVNGEQIHLHTLQTLLDSRTAAMGMTESPSYSTMRKNYGMALNTLIAHALVRQELDQLDKAVSDQEFQQAIDEINEDYGPDGLDKFLESASLRKDDWLRLMRDYLSLEIFKNQVLLPGIKISLPEIKKYYEEHKKDFELPNTVRVCFMSASQKELLENICGNVKQHAVDEVFPEEVVSQCLITPVSDIPPEWQNDLKNLKVPACAKIRKGNEEWQTIALFARHDGGTVPLSESYAFIENILAREKQNDAFYQWLEQKINKSKIMVSPQMRECMTLADEEEETPQKETSAEETR